MKFQFFEHGRDVAVRVEGTNPLELMAAATAAFNQIVVGGAGVPERAEPGPEESAEVLAPSAAGVVIEWVKDLTYLLENSNQLVVPESIPDRGHFTEKENEAWEFRSADLRTWKLPSGFIPAQQVTGVDEHGEALGHSPDGRVWTNLIIRRAPAE